MDSDNYVAATGRGTFVVVVGGVLAGEFLSQDEAERAYNALRFGSTTIPIGYPSQAPCSGPTPAPGGYWACDANGNWQLQAEPIGGGPPSGSSSPGPTPSPANQAPSSPSQPHSPPANAPPAPSDDPIAQLAARLGVGRRDLLAAGAIVAVAVVLR